MTFADVPPRVPVNTPGAQPQGVTLLPYPAVGEYVYAFRTKYAVICKSVVKPDVNRMTGE